MKFELYKTPVIKANASETYKVKPKCLPEGKEGYIIILSLGMCFRRYCLKIFLFSGLQQTTLKIHSQKY